MKDAKIMVVDDEPKNQMIMEGILDETYDVVCVSSGEECLEKVESENPNIILLDIMMPGKDGYEVCQELQSNPATSMIPVVFVSAKDSLEDRMKGYEVGGVDYFVKPFDHDELLVKVKKILEFQKQESTLKKSAEEASQVALQAMGTNSELGQILRYLQSSFLISTYTELCEAVFELLSAGGLNAVVQVRAGGEVLTLSDKGTVSPLEVTILEQAQSKGRIIDFKQRTIFNHDHTSILIKNMPLDDEIRYGLIKDNLCYVLDGLEARITGIFNEEKQKTINENLIDLIGFINTLVAHLNSELYNIRVKGAGIIEDMKEEIDRLIPNLGLIESQESSLEKITEAAARKSFDLFDKGLKLDEQMNAALKQLDEITENRDLDSGQMAEILKNLF